MGGQFATRCLHYFQGTWAEFATSRVVYVLRKDVSFRGVTITIVAVYVDDLIILSNDTTSLNKIKAELGKRFEMKDLGEIRFCLGIQVMRNRKERTIRISQAKYIENILDRFNMLNCK